MLLNHSSCTTFASLRSQTLHRIGAQFDVRTLLESRNTSLNMLRFRRNDQRTRKNKRRSNRLFLLRNPLTIYRKKQFGLVILDVAFQAIGENVILSFLVISMCYHLAMCQEARVKGADLMAGDQTAVAMDRA